MQTRCALQCRAVLRNAFCSLPCAIPTGAVACADEPAALRMIADGRAPLVRISCSLPACKESGLGSLRRPRRTRSRLLEDMSGPATSLDAHTGSAGRGGRAVPIETFDALLMAPWSTVARSFMLPFHDGRDTGRCAAQRSRGRGAGRTRRGTSGGGRYGEAAPPLYHTRCRLRSSGSVSICDVEPSPPQYARRASSSPRPISRFPNLPKSTEGSLSECSRVLTR